MSAALLLRALALGAAVAQLSVDRPVFPGEGDPAAIAHLALRGAPEAELSLYRIRRPLEALASPEGGHRRSTVAMPPPLEAKTASELRSVHGLYRELWQALRPAARELAKTAFDLQEPLGAMLPRPEPEPSAVATGEPLVRAWRVGAAEPGWTYSDIPLGPLEAGAYRLVARAGEARSEVVLLSTRLALLAERSRRGVSLLAMNVRSGAPIADVEIWGAEGGGAKPSLLGRTQQNGLLVLRTPVDGAVIGRSGADLAWASLPPPILEPEPATRVAAAFVLDRSTYRPGETVHARAL
ncbi:MAG: hypothetical protein ACYCWW_14665, partial [Deltaproteobacteria bacterium]